LKLCIAEKPSVAKEIADVLGAKRRYDGYYEGNGYQVCWTFGHLCTLKEPHDYLEQWKRWSLFSLPMLPRGFGIKVINDSGIQKQFDTICRLVESCDEVINCGVAGIEGEVIQRWVLTKAKSEKPLKRLWISSLTEEAIKEGFSNLRDGHDFDLLYSAGNSRAVGDWLLGMNATRLYTIKYANNRGVLSIGRVQTPTLALIVNRHKEIKDFVPKTYFELKTKYRDVIFSSTKGKFEDKEKIQNIVEAIKEEEFEITSFTRKKGKESAPRLLDLTSLQVEANKKYGMSAEDTLKHTQKLYEKKMLTYPRVDTTYLPEDMYPKIPGILKGMEPYAEYTEKLLGQKIRKSKKVFDNNKITDHHAIIPTGVSPSGLILDEKRIYDIVARRFLAVFYPDCIVSNTTVLGKAGDVKFKATGKQILEDGWRELFKSSTPDKPDSDAQIMPEFEEGERGPHEPFAQERQTTPPKPYTEATLLRAMETAGKQVDDDELRDLMKENGIGRPSTRANIIETLFRRRYIEKKRKSLHPTQTGIDLINTIKNDLLKSVELTGIWEKKLRQIEKGEYEAKVFVEEMKTMVSELVNEVKYDNSQSISIPDKEEEEKSKKSPKKAAASKKPAKKAVEKSKESKEKEAKTSEKLVCPKCGKGEMLKGKAAWGCSRFKEDCKFILSFEIVKQKYNTTELSSKILEDYK
jgi:DNA topoisomerase-3